MKLDEFLAELSSLENQASEAASVGQDPMIKDIVSEILKQADKMDRSWSGSWLGYQARVYLRDFRAKGPRDFFDRDNGIVSSRGEWCEIDVSRVWDTITKTKDFEHLDACAGEASASFDLIRSEFLVILDILLGTASDSVVERARDDVRKMSCGSTTVELINALAPKNYRTHDIPAYAEGVVVPVHQNVRARVMAFRSRWESLKKLHGAIVSLRKYIEGRIRFDSIGLERILGNSNSPPSLAVTSTAPPSISAGRDVYFQVTADMAGSFSADHGSQIRQDSVGDASVDRDEFERDVAEILGMLVDAKEDLASNYDSLRVALRKLNQIELANKTSLDEVRSSYLALLTEQDKGALRKLAETGSAMGVNIVSSGVWSLIVEPLIKSM